MLSAEVRAAAERIQRTLQGRCDVDERATVTIVTGLSADEVLEAFGADPAEPPVARRELAEAGPAVSLLEVPGGVVAVEDGGLEGASAPVLHRASARGRAAAVSWGPAGDPDFAVGRGGAVHAAGAFSGIGEVGDDPEITPAFDGLGVAAADREVPMEVLGIIAAERYTGVRIDAPPAEGTVPVHRVLPHLPLQHPRDPPPRLWPGLGDDRRFVAAVDRATAAQQRRFTGFLTRLLLENAGLLDLPELQRTLATLDRPEGGDLDPAAERLLRRALHSVPGGPGQDVASRSLQVLYQALNPDPRTAALAVAAAAQKAVPAGSRADLPGAALATIESIVEWGTVAAEAGEPLHGPTGRGPRPAAAPTAARGWPGSPASWRP